MPFLPEWLLKNVKQYNGVHGDKPKVALPNIPPTPRKPYFGSVKNRYEKRNMELHWKDLEFAAQDVEWDATEMFEELASANPMHDSTTSKVDVLNENATTHGSGDDIDPSLSLKSMFSFGDMDFRDL